MLIVATLVDRTSYMNTFTLIFLNILGGFESAMNETRSMSPWAHTHQLNGYHEDGFQGESAVAEVEQILQTGAEELQDHGVVLPAWPEVKHLRNPFCRKQKHKTTVTHIALIRPKHEMHRHNGIIQIQ